MAPTPSEPTAAYRTDDYAHETPDGTELAIRVFRPTGAGSFPTLLQRTPYGRPETPDGLAVAVRALDAGYAVAYEDTRGRGDSDGEFLPWVHEAADGAATIEWRAEKPWATGRGGRFVVSTDAHTTGELDFMHLGISQARRGWCEASDVLNTRPLEALISFFDE
jgi:predicted acyl esterase